MATYKRNDDRVVGKIILHATLQNKTPLLIGKGEGDIADVEQMLWPEGNKPYIPASSIAGCLKSYFRYWDLDDPGNRFWGFQDEHPQSHIRFDDLVPANPPGQDIKLRDGVKIDPVTNTAEDKKKYDYQVVEPGIDFPFRAEITVRAGMNIAQTRQFVSDIHAILLHPEFRIGAQTNTGFGKIDCTGFIAWHFEFPQHEAAWFDYLSGLEFEAQELDFEEENLSMQMERFSINATFSLKNSLIIGAYGIKGDEPDKSQLKSRNKFVLPGKSIRGAVRHRALKILNTQGVTDVQDQINHLFGYVDELNNKQKKGRLRIDESYLTEEEVKAMQQNRIRIDRFTGGVIGGALFNSEPIWTTGQEVVRLSFTITKSAKPEEIKLLLLVLKDLWLEDLAIGGEKNIGRGILTGQSAEIKHKGEVVAAFQRNGQGAGLEFTKGSVATLNELLQPKTDTHA